MCCHAGLAFSARDKLAAISQTMFFEFILFFCKIVVFRYKIHEMRPQLMLINTGSDNGLAPRRRQAII